MIALRIELLVNPTRRKIKKALEKYVKDLSLPARFHEALKYVLLREGKLLRPAIVLFVAEALNKGRDAMGAALAIELSHVASLIADDLPCMDDEMERRNQPTLHRQFDEATALLVSYGLVNASYDCLMKNSRKLIDDGLPTAAGDALFSKAIEIVAQSVGFQGTVAGQYLDLFGAKDTVEEVETILNKKTVTLFQVAFSLGWLYGGGEVSKLQLVERAAKSFGMAFQTCDDLLDLAEDSKSDSTPNLVLKMGEKEADQKFHSYLMDYEKFIEELGIASVQLKGFSQFLRERWEKAFSQV